MAPETAWRDLFTTPLAEADPEIHGLVRKQEKLNRDTVNLVASETYCPLSTLEAEASAVINKNASGYPPRSGMGGAEVIDEIEHIAVARAKRLFGAEHANIQSLSSTVANSAVVRALLSPGDRILSFAMDAGGHVSHGGDGHISGQDYAVRTFGVDAATGAPDYAAAEDICRSWRPNMIIAGASSYPNEIDFARLGAMARDVGALLFADIAHVSGLIIAGIHRNPVPLADVTTTSTHKTFCGPRTGGLVLCKARYAVAIDEAIAPGLQAAPGAHIIAARAVLFDLVTRPAFRDLMHAIVANARILADALTSLQVPLFAGGTESHMVVLDLRRSDWTGPALIRHLMRHGLAANTTGLPALDGGASRLGLRIGSPPMTIRGMDAEEFGAVAEALARVVDMAEDQTDAALGDRIRGLARRHPPPVA